MVVAMMLGYGEAREGDGLPAASSLRKVQVSGLQEKAGYMV